MVSSVPLSSSALGDGAKVFLLQHIGVRSCGSERSWRVDESQEVLDRAGSSSEISLRHRARLGVIAKISTRT